MAKRIKKEEKKWRAFGYCRLSVEDGESGESNSVRSQREMIEQWASTQEDLELVGFYEDDGWSGSNFERPGFKDMMAALEDSSANAVIVKDLSRFGRNYLEVGSYLERTFPKMGVRLVAIYDDYDGMREISYSDSLLVPFKNLINDNYCATTSSKTKASLDVKRRQGDFVGAFAPFGYVKDPKDRNHLLVDDDAAETVRQIFAWRLEGYSDKAIARKLDELGIPCPEEHKRKAGVNHNQPGRMNATCSWHAGTVHSILKNEVYVGNLVQGRWFRPSFRTKEVLLRPEDEWVRVEETHEGIVDKRTFDLTQKIMERDTRCAPGKDKVYLLSGLLFCADCGNTMVRRVVKTKYKTYRYYDCGSWRYGKAPCTPHSVEAEPLEEAVSKAVLALCAKDVRKAWEGSAGPKRKQLRLRSLESQRRKLEAELSKSSAMLGRLESDFLSGVISRDDLDTFSAVYRDRIDAAREQAARVSDEVLEVQSSSGDAPWVEAVERWSNEATVSRAMLVELVDRIEVREDGEIDIVFNFRDEIAALED